MAPLPRDALHFLFKRDRNFSAGAIAGIIVGIVVVFLILVGIFIWRFMSYRDDFGTYSARSRIVDAREKARMQIRGHVRSTRPKDMVGVDRGSKTVDGNALAHNEDEMEEDRPSPIMEDDQSLNGTVHEEENHDAVNAEKERQAEKTNTQERDFEIFQGHHETH